MMKALSTAWWIRRSNEAAEGRRRHDVDGSTWQATSQNWFQAHTRPSRPPPAHLTTTRLATNGKTVRSERFLNEAAFVRADPRSDELRALPETGLGS